MMPCPGVDGGEEKGELDAMSGLICRYRNRILSSTEHTLPTEIEAMMMLTEKGPDMSGKLTLIFST